MDSSVEAKEVLESRLSQANRAAKFAADKYLGGRRLADFHQIMRDPSKQAALGITDEQMERINGMPEKWANLIREVPDIANKLLGYHEAFIKSQVMRFARKIGRTNHADVADFSQEALVAFLEACRGFSNEEFCFLTYLGTSIKRRLQRSTATRKGVTEETLAAYYRAEHMLAAQGDPHSFHDIVAAMTKLDEDTDEMVPVDLDAKQVRSLYLAVQPMLGESELKQKKEGSKGSLEALAVDKSARGLDYDFSQHLDTMLTGLNDLEGDSIKAYLHDLFPDALPSLAAVAAKHGVSPQAANYAKERVRLKLARGLASME